MELSIYRSSFSFSYFSSFNGFFCKRKPRLWSFGSDMTINIHIWCGSFIVSLKPATKSRNPVICRMPKIIVFIFSIFDQFECFQSPKMVCIHQWKVHTKFKPKPLDFLSQITIFPKMVSFSSYFGHILEFGVRQKNWAMGLLLSVPPIIKNIMMGSDSSSLLMQYFAPTLFRKVFELWPQNSWKNVRPTIVEHLLPCTCTYMSQMKLGLYEWLYT